MSIAFLLDEHLRGVMWHGIARHNARGDYPIGAVRVGDAPDLPLGSNDTQILIWAETHNRVLISLDRRTLPDHFEEHLRRGDHSPGVLLLHRRLTIPHIIEQLVLMAHFSEEYEWRDRIESLR